MVAKLGWLANPVEKKHLRVSLTYQQSIAQLLSLADFERKARADESPDFHIRRTSLLLEELGNPHLKVPAIHVAGSKGKGSTCAMIAAALAANGLRTGMFISPHLHKMTERLTVDGTPISEAEFVSLFERIWPMAEKIRDRGDSGIVSVFEFQTAMAFQHFADIDADVMVIEVGLGGRLDSTNVLQPAVSVITTVGYDHVAVLGNTLAKIASEKAGIIKPGVPVVVSQQPYEAAEVIAETARRLGSPLIESSSLSLSNVDPNGAGPQLVTVRSPHNEYEIKLPLLGEHQLANASTAVAALEAFSENVSALVPEAVVRGISSVKWPGRVQVVEQGPPMIIVDGAHNQDSAEALCATISRHFGLPHKPVIILGATGGHDPLAVARTFADLAPRVIVTRSRHPKAVEPLDFAEALRQVKIAVLAVTESTHDALEIARQPANAGTMIIATGSLFVAAEVIETVSGIEPEIYPDLRGSAGPLRLGIERPMKPGSEQTEVPASLR